MWSQRWTSPGSPNTHLQRSPAVARQRGAGERQEEAEDGTPDDDDGRAGDAVHRDRDGRDTVAQGVQVALIVNADHARVAARVADGRPGQVHKGLVAVDRLDDAVGTDTAIPPGLSGRGGVVGEP